MWTTRESIRVVTSSAAFPSLSLMEIQGDTTRHKPVSRSRNLCWRSDQSTHSKQFPLPHPPTVPSLFIPVQLSSLSPSTLPANPENGVPLPSAQTPKAWWETLRKHSGIWGSVTLSPCSPPPHQAPTEPFLTVKRMQLFLSGNCFKQL